MHPKRLALLPLLASLACQAGGAATTSDIRLTGQAPALNGEHVRTWAYQLEPYLHVVRLEKGVDLRNGSVSDRYDIDLGGGSVVDLSGGLRGEARHSSGWGVLVDASYVDPGDDQYSKYATFDPRVRQTVLEIFALRRMNARGLDLFAGLRGWNVQATWRTRTFGIPGENENLSGDEQWIDPVVGARWLRSVSPRWETLTRVDIGGFGIGSDFSWTVAVGGRYRLNDKLFLNLQYRALGVDFPRDAGSPSSIGYDTIVHGPRIGLVFGF